MTDKVYIPKKQLVEHVVSVHGFRPSVAWRIKDLETAHVEGEHNQANWDHAETDFFTYESDQL